MTTKLWVSKNVRELMQEYEAEPIKPKYHNGDYRVYKAKTEPIKRICKKCNKEFEQPKKHNCLEGIYFKYCPDCRRIRKDNENKNRICLFCHKPLPEHSHSRLAFCGESCQLQYTIDYYRKRNADLKPKEVIA